MQKPTRISAASVVAAVVMAASLLVVVGIDSAAWPRVALVEALGTAIALGALAALFVYRRLRAWFVALGAGVFFGTLFAAGIISDLPPAQARAEVALGAYALTVAMALLIGAFVEFVAFLHRAAHGGRSGRLRKPEKLVG